MPTQNLQVLHSSLYAQPTCFASIASVGIEFLELTVTHPRSDTPPLNPPSSELLMASLDLWPANTPSFVSDAQIDLIEQANSALGNSNDIATHPSASQQSESYQIRQGSQVGLWQEGAGRVNTSHDGENLDDNENHSTVQGPSGPQPSSARSSSLDNERLRRSIRQVREQNTQLSQERDAARRQLDAVRTRINSLDQLLEDVMYREGMPPEVFCDLLTFSSALANLRGELM